MATTPREPLAQPTWLVLHGPFDPSVGPLVQHLRQRLAGSGAAGQVLALSLPVLMGVLRWRLWLDAGGGTRFALDAPGWRLCDAAGLASPADAPAATGRVCGVINRLPDPMPQPDQADADYRASEWRALLSAWLNGLSEQGVPVLNRARPDALCGGGRSRTTWRAMAAQLGLPVVAWSGQAGGAVSAASPWAWDRGWEQGGAVAGPDDGGAQAAGAPDLLLVGARCWRAPASALAAAWPRAWERPLLRLAQQAQCAVLGVHLRAAAEGTGAGATGTGEAEAEAEGGCGVVFSDVSPAPDLSAWGASAWDALGDALALPAAATAASVRRSARRTGGAAGNGAHA